MSKSNNYMHQHRYVRDLERLALRQRHKIEIMTKTGCTPKSTREERLDALEHLYWNDRDGTGKCQYSNHELCEALGVSRGTFLNRIYRSKRKDNFFLRHREDVLAKVAKAFYDNNEDYGSKKLTYHLREHGEHVSVGMVRWALKKLGLKAQVVGAKKRYLAQVHQNRLQNQFNADRPNEKWVGDITQVRACGRTLYICAVIDLYSRFVVAYKVSVRNNSRLTKGTFNAAWSSRKPKQGLIFHSDRGGSYDNIINRMNFDRLGVLYSQSRPGCPQDNPVMESFFSRLKSEHIYRHDFYKNIFDFRRRLERYMHYYNNERLHSYRGYSAPAQKEKKYYEKNEGSRLSNPPIE